MWAVGKRDGRKMEKGKKGERTQYKLDYSQYTVLGSKDIIVESRLLE